MTNGLLFLIFLLISVIGMRLGRVLFRRMQILDKPGKDVPKRDPVPTLQGVAAIFVFIVLLVVIKYAIGLGYIGREFLALFVGGGIIAAISIIDELGRLVHPRYRLSGPIRLVVQIAVAVLARGVSGVGIWSLSIPGIGLLELSQFTSLLLTIGRFVLCINAINRSDGIYGLGTGNASIGFLTIFLLITVVVFPEYEFMSLERSELLIRVQIISLALFALSLVATIGEYKPWGLLRDVGVMFFGFALGYLALLGGAKIGTLIVVLALPLFDAFRVVIDRIKNGISPFRGNWIHLHYRLMTLGRNRHEVRRFIWGRGLFFVTIMLSLGGDRVGKIVVFVTMALVYFGVNAYLFRYKKLPYEYNSQNDEGYSEEEIKR